MTKFETKVSKVSKFYENSMSLFFGYDDEDSSYINANQPHITKIDPNKDNKSNSIKRRSSLIKSTHTEHINIPVPQQHIKDKFETELA